MFGFLHTTTTFHNLLLLLTPPPPPPPHSMLVLLVLLLLVGVTSLSLGAVHGDAGPGHVHGGWPHVREARHSALAEAEQDFAAHGFLDGDVRSSSEPRCKEGDRGTPVGAAL